MTKSNPCGKQVYPTPSIAEIGIKAISGLQRKPKSKSSNLDYYWCDACKGFHHTSRQLSDSEVKNRTIQWNKHLEKIKNQPANMEYTDETVLTFGKHKGKTLADVPAAYLIWLYNEGIRDEGLKAYVEDNMQALRKEVDDAASNHFKNKRQS